MERSVVPSQLKGSVKAPSSKSMTQRAIAAALLAGGESRIKNPSYCDDSLAAMSIAVGLGARVEPHPGELIINGSRNLKETKLNCGESGLAIRMFSPIAALYPVDITMSGAKSLRKRPMNMIVEALTQLGVRCSGTDGFLPLNIRGPLSGGICEIDGSVSSQLLTGLLMALPLAAEDSEIIVSNLKSKPYIDMTIGILDHFGINISNENYEVFRIKGNQKYHATSYEVEGDWSGAAFLLVAGAINGDITVTGLSTESQQSDMAVMEALTKSEARFTVDGNSIHISKSDLKSFDFDATESPDLFPPLVTLAAYCHGISTIKGVSRLKHKESDRAVALRDEFGKLGINVELDGDIMRITGGRPSGGRIESHDDHRIAMAGAVADLGASGRIYIHDSQCISKSYPGFFDDLRNLGAVVYE